MGPLQKTNRLLQIILSAFLLIAFRVWHLASIQREEKLTEARRPQRRTIIQQADRGVITDRFGIPLALNRICYRICVCYNEISQIPAVKWVTDESGTKSRSFPRREYVQSLSEMLSEMLSMDRFRIEDLIYSKASLFPHVPFVIASNLSEQQHYRLKGLERLWPGLHAEIGSERFYPLGKTASHILGYLGAIDQKEYLAIAAELELLQQMISTGSEDESIVLRYQELKEKAYTLRDFVGKAGIEKQYEQPLRGFYGKKTFEIDQKGSYLHELPGSKEAIAGSTVALSISAELQEYCEQLLMEDEKARDGRSLGIDPSTKTKKSQKQPWIKGGSIVALDPNTGEILAFASTPRFDPNDFILSSNKEEKLPKIRRWQETPQYVASLWDGTDWLFRERAKGEETACLSWDVYLQWILPQDSPLTTTCNRIDDLKTAIALQEDFEALLYFSGNPDPSLLIDALFTADKPCRPKTLPKTKESILEALRQHGSDTVASRRHIDQILHSIPNNQDKLFVIDLCRMAVYSPAFSDELIAKLGSCKLSFYRTLSQAFHRIEREIRSASLQTFRLEQFPLWRKEHQKEFLSQMRKEEKEQKSYAKPYLDYLDRKEQELFEKFWQEVRLPLIAAIIKQDTSHLSDEAALYLGTAEAPSNDLNLLRTSANALGIEETVQWLKTMRPFRHLDRPLWGSYRQLKGKPGQQTEQDLASAFYPAGGFGYSRSHAFQTAAPVGSLFKLVTGWEALRQRPVGSSQNPLTLLDEVRLDEKDHSLIVATTMDRKGISRHYKGGRLPRSHLPNLGKVDLVGAIEQSSNPYFALLASDYLSHPQDLVRAAADFGFGEKSGIDLPREYKGKLPSDVDTNRTGLYSFAIGQHTLVGTPLQVAVMMGALGNRGYLLSPTISKSLQGIPAQTCGRLTLNTTPFHEELALLGIDFPLFSSVAEEKPICTKQLIEARLRRTLFLSSWMRNLLFEGMDRVLWGAKGSARPSAIRSLALHPHLFKDFLSLQHQVIGKTSTAEILWKPDAAPSSGPQMYKHIWFGALSFTPPSKSIKDYKELWDHPELAVAVYLRFGDGGREAAPLAIQVIQKWRAIQANRAALDCHLEQSAEK